MNREKAEKLRAIQDATYVNMLAVLEKYHMCNVERPTGFGKHSKEFCSSHEWEEM